MTAAPETWTLLTVIFDWGGLVDTTIYTVLASGTLGLMVLVTAGIIYLTAAEWRDRRRQEKEKRSR
ncbi:MAG: hypothetical protein ACRC8Y_11840 [Chroococcales cyanobacterium]